MKKVNLSLGQILDLDAELVGQKNPQTGELITPGVLDLELDLVVKYYLEKLVKQTTEQKNLVDKLREDLIKKHGTQNGDSWGISMFTDEVKDETGKVISGVINPAFVTFKEDISKLLEQEAEIVVKELKIEDFVGIKTKTRPKQLFDLLEENEIIA